MPNRATPQPRTLFFWAARYFDVWLSCKDSSIFDAMPTSQTRGWKEGTMTKFFDLKDKICLEKHPAWDDRGNLDFGNLLKIQIGISVLLHNAYFILAPPG
jgi:hypothetical protein